MTPASAGKEHEAIHAAPFVTPAKVCVALLIAAALLALGAASPARAQGTVTVAVGDIWFCAPEFQNAVCDTEVEVGDTVAWDFTGSELPHTSTECGASCDDPTETPLWDSGLIGPGSPDQTFEYTFYLPGVYLYYCEVHPFTQRGRIIVGEPALVGDVNCDRSINAIDAALVLQLTAGLVSSLPCQENADTNEDGRVNAIDAQLILQFSAGLLRTLPP